jgi:hypothetical protein
MEDEFCARRTATLVPRNDVWGGPIRIVDGVHAALVVIRGFSLISAVPAMFAVMLSVVSCQLSAVHRSISCPVSRNTTTRRHPTPPAKPDPASPKTTDNRQPITDNKREAQ